jgi:hypothetical protein
VFVSPSRVSPDESAYRYITDPDKNSSFLSVFLQLVTLPACFTALRFDAAEAYIPFRRI